MKQLSVDVSIVGGGIVGLTLAIALSQQGLKVVVIDKSMNASQSYDARVYALNQAAFELFDTIGIASKLLEQEHGIYHDMVIWEKSSHYSLSLTSRTHRLDQLGWIVAQNILISILREAMHCEKNIIFIEDGVVEHIDPIIARIDLKSDLSIHSKLIVGADGANSVVRQKLDFVVSLKSYEQTALVASIHHLKPHQNTAYQCFDKGEPLAFLPLSDQYQSSIVWSCSPNNIKLLLDLSMSEFENKLQAAIEYKLGEVKLLNERITFPLNQRHIKHYFHGRVALMGDAAHTIHPMAGLGLNLGLMDAKQLMDCVLIAFKKKRDIGAKTVLRRYERSRSTHNALMLKLLDLLKLSFTRGVPFNWIDRRPWIKHKIINIAHGAYSLPMILK